MKITTNHVNYFFLTILGLFILTSAVSYIGSRTIPNYEEYDLYKRHFEEHRDLLDQLSKDGFTWKEWFIIKWESL